jgi:acyl-CoA thioesterase II
VPLVNILTIEEVGPDCWVASSPANTLRNDIFGGQVAAQALRAAALTVGPQYPHSVHCYFLRRGRSTLPIEIQVERVRQGRTYTSRRVDVRQEGKTIFAMLASFHADEPGREFELQMPAGVPDPDGLPPARPLPWESDLEARPIQTDGPIVRWWGRVSPFPADSTLHYCGLLYASDLGAGGAAMAAVGLGFGGWPVKDSGAKPVGNFGSLDHALWFHRQPAIDEWFFCEVRPLSVRDSRGLVIGTMFDRAGRHLASFTQEIFLKLG